MSFFSTDPHQATFQPRLNLLGFPLLFNPTPKFLGVTFDRTLSFGTHVQSLCSKFYPRHKALRSIATASWGPTKESFSLLYKAFVRSVLRYASPGWFPFLCNTATNHLEVLHRAACRVITGCLFSTPSSLLLLEAQLPSLKLTLEHQTLYSFARTPLDLNHLLLDCRASEPLPKSIFGPSLSILDLWSRPWGVARLLGLRGVPLRSHPSEGVG